MKIAKHYKKQLVVSVIVGMLLPAIAFANGMLFGSILNEKTGQPIKNAVVTVEECGETISDVRGMFNLSCPAAEYSITVAADKYEEQTLDDIELNKGQQKRLNIRMGADKGSPKMKSFMDKLGYILGGYASDETVRDYEEKKYRKQQQQNQGQGGYYEDSGYYDGNYDRQQKNQDVNNNEQDESWEQVDWPDENQSEGSTSADNNDNQVDWSEPEPQDEAIYSDNPGQRESEYADASSPNVVQEETVKNTGNQKYGGAGSISQSGRSVSDQGDDTDSNILVGTERTTSSNQRQKNVQVRQRGQDIAQQSTRKQVFQNVLVKPKITKATGIRVTIGKQAFNVLLTGVGLSQIKRAVVIKPDNRVDPNIRVVLRENTNNGRYFSISATTRSKPGRNYYRLRLDTSSGSLILPSKLVAIEIYSNKSTSNQPQDIRMQQGVSSARKKNPVSVRKRQARPPPSSKTRFPVNRVPR